MGTENRNEMGNRAHLINKFIGTDYDKVLALAEYMPDIVYLVDQLRASNLSVADGKSAYDLAVENGFVGTVTEWLDSLKGEVTTNYDKVMSYVGRVFSNETDQTAGVVLVHPDSMSYRMDTDMYYVLDTSGNFPVWVVAAETRPRPMYWVGELEALAVSAVLPMGTVYDKIEA